MEKIKLLYATGNPAKLSYMRQKLEGMCIELTGLSDVEAPPEVRENGSSPLENARIKALAYYDFYKIPLFSCDSGLYFDNVPDELQPGVNVRRVGGKALTDAEMTEYYAGLAKRFGRLTARYKNGICLVLSKNEVYESMDESLSGAPFYIVDKPHPKADEGFPLDRISVHIRTGKYYYDMEPADYDSDIIRVDGFRRFFADALNLTMGAVK